MPWMLQPHAYTQVIRPNLYRVDYKRVGAYKGMGGLGQAVDLTTAIQQLPVGPAMPTVSLSPSLQPVYTFQTPGGPVSYGGMPAGAPAGTTIGQWFSQNAGLLAIGVVLVVILASSRR